MAGCGRVIIEVSIGVGISEDRFNGIYVCVGRSDSKSDHHTRHCTELFNSSMPICFIYSHVSS